MTVSVGAFMLRHPELKNSMEAFMMRFVLPEFTSSEPYMRAIVSLVQITLNLGFQTPSIEQACQVLAIILKSGFQWSSEEVLYFPDLQCPLILTTQKHRT